MKTFACTGILWCVAAGLVATIGCRNHVQPAVAGPLQVFVSIPPQKYFIEKIGGEFCSVTTLIPPGASPHSYEPKPAQMAGLAKTRLYFSIGIEVEKVWLPKIMAINPELTVIATDSGIDKLSMMDEDGHAAHEHAGVDPHVWLSPFLVKKQARIVASALIRYDTAHAALFGERLSLFEAEIDSLHATIVRNLAECTANRTFLVFHPSWGYFAQEFSLQQIAIEVEGKEPGIRELGGIVNEARKREVGAVLIQPQFSRALAATIAKEMGVPTAVADPLAEDWAENLLRITGVLCGK